jgi:DNA end-binding protein Ku
LVVADLPRSAWNGTLRLRELVLPVGLVSAKRKGDVQLALLHRDCGLRVEIAKACPAHGKLADEDLVKGWEIAPGEYMPVDVDELAAVAPRDTRTIDVYAIVADDTIEQLLNLKSYLLLPTKSRVSVGGYAILAEALQLEQVVALARFVAFGAEHLAAIRGRDLLLEVQELAPHADLRDSDGIRAAICDADAPVADRDVELARKLLDRLRVPFEPALLTNLHRGRLQQLLDTKLAGGTPTIVQPANEPPPAVSVDIGHALERSLRTVPRSRKARVDEALARA